VRYRRPRTALATIVLAFIAVAVACEEPTQVTVRISTTDKCSNLSDVHTFVGPDATVTEKRFGEEVSTGVSDRCDEPGGFIGTLVVTPGGGSGTILVAVGVRGGDGTPAPPANKCWQPDTAKRCIIARRKFSFIENKPLVLPINLDPLCVGQSCDPASTCFKGSCVSSEVVCAGADCGLAEENPGGIATGEGGASESGSSDGAYDAELDGLVGEDVFDSGVSTDAMPDVSADADGGPTVNDGAAAYPPCSMFVPNWACLVPQNGTKFPGTCDDMTSPMTYSCCRCSCPGSGKPVSCLMSAASTSCSMGATTCP
jgi:hypothetical protein